ncbi:MAG: hypothetical protein Q8L68_05745 [Methylococcales bacterium]|nr:hypothetical protein [Methylococcales bacterium]
MNSQTEEVGLPPRESNFESLNAERVYRTGLSAKYYLDLEKECAQRTTVEKKMTPFKLTQTVMTLYLQRKLVLLKDLPADLQAAIAQHYA